jgi:hypothetical protein
MRIHPLLRTARTLLGVALFSALTAAVLSPTALAMSDAPGWEVNSRSYPTNLPPGGSGVIQVSIYNVGAANPSGTATVTDTLPEGLTGVSSEEWKCAEGTPSTCSYEIVSSESGGVPVGTSIFRDLTVNVSPTAVPGGRPNHVTISGGGAPNPASSANLMRISSAANSFGLVGADAWFTNADGTIDTQAGSHPYEVSFNLAVNSRGETNGPIPPSEREEARNLTVDLPSGVIGNPTALAQCTRKQFDEVHCPASSQIGDAFVQLSEFPLELPVYNLVPPPGTPAQFAFDITGIPAFLDAGVRSDGDYGITEHVDNIAQRRITTANVTLWGVPSDPSHDPQRCQLEGELRHCGLPSSGEHTPFLTLPTACEGPQEFSVEADTWQSEATKAGYKFLTHDANDVPVGFTGCDQLGFAPSISVAPDTTQADTPAGFTVELKVPQEGLTSAEGLATSNIKNTTVTLPAGVVINPGQAAGLVACQTSEDGVGTQGPPACPSGSKVGTVAIATPLLKDRLEGDVYVLQSDPPDLKLLVAASAEGVNLKLVGDVHLSEATGQLTTTFENTPELPFTDFKLSFTGGAQAALATPAVCGVYATSADFTPWSAPFLPDAISGDSFSVDRRADGSSCTAPLPFTPSLSAGATTDQAGGFTDFSLLLQRADDQQRISTLSFKTPKGLLGMIAKVPLCGEPQAAQGTCPAASEIGHTVVTAGPGPYPLEIPEPGQAPAPIYLTGGYGGGPYGLSIVVPVIAGPFNLGVVVVRASIGVDPRTAQLTVTTDPLPSILDGIPTDLRTIDAVIDRPGFMFNPTNCEPQSFAGVAKSTQGATAAISSHFQVGSCQSLKFAPNFKVTTQARTSRRNGASLEAKILYPTGAAGANQANIASVKVDLPKQLPSRLTTLQKACTAAVFEANPASCPKASVVGHATALTPVLPVELTGPAYFVSHGGEQFPSLIVVLQGYGVTVDLVGSTFISHAGITSSTFKQVPDVPITSFDLTLPEGRYSALAANLPAKAKGSFCGQALAMPTAFKAQNGAEIHQSTKLSVSGCAKAVRKTAKKRKPKAKK